MSIIADNVAEPSSIAAKLEALRKETLHMMGSTCIVALKIVSPCQGVDHPEHVKVYFSKNDPDVKDLNHVYARYQTGREVSSHITLLLPLAQEQENVKMLQEKTADLVKGLTLKVTGIRGLEPNPDALNLGAKGHALVMELEASKDLLNLRNTFACRIPCAHRIFKAEDYEKPPVASFMTHTTIGWFEKDSVEEAKKWAQQFVGTNVVVSGWYQ